MTGWRLLLSGPGEPGFNMALDEALALAVRRGWSPPTLRIYQWQSPAISLGCHQPLSVLQGFGGMGPGVAVVRRPTAGGAVAHSADVSYALVCDTVRLREHPSRLLYARFHAALGRALAVGCPSCRPPAGGYALSANRAPALPEQARCFEQPVADDLMAGSRKVAGAAQRRWRDGLLQQGTVVASGCSPDRVALSIRTAWAEVFRQRFTVGTLTVQERLLADELWRKYRPWTPSSWPPVIPSASNRSR
ncbi:MAG: hypothetical protein A3C53_08175 [Omnitrophica WOR_2 bacterium RIFCSPHIGHO2_02_FULL_68_15]|nr:MAG: hypothetical protein A3C53_08175 [Omnitrophica WOR_2 bacterium RIFCSPHIGHO2_02_FULL_68_15]